METSNNFNGDAENAGYDFFNSVFNYSLKNELEHCWNIFQRARESSDGK